MLEKCSKVGILLLSSVYASSLTGQRVWLSMCLTISHAKQRNERDIKKPPKPISGLIFTFHSFLYGVGNCAAPSSGTAFDVPDQVSLIFNG